MFDVISHAKVKKISETERVLPSWLSQPTKFPGGQILENSQDLDLFDSYIDEQMRQHLKKELKIKKLFPLQACLIPSLTRQLNSRPFRRPNDLCVSSPTGSGKTLAYVLPIVSHYKSRFTTSLKVLVILPIRDLAVQVHKTFVQVSQVTSLQVGLAVSETDFNNLCQTLVDREILDCSPSKGTSISARGISCRYSSAVDILVATPGTLVDLIQKCPGFSIEDVEILVIDEADRLMSNNRHDWLNTVERSIFRGDSRSSIDCPCHSMDSSWKERVCYSGTNGCSLDQSFRSRPLHKLLFSATLSSDPQLLLHMNLFQPRLFVATRQTESSDNIPSAIDNGLTKVRTVGQTDLLAVTSKNELLTSSTIPEQLEEKMFVVEPKKSISAKLFVIYYLFHVMKIRRVICFVNKVETSGPLCKFINEISNVKAAEFSSNMKSSMREKYLSEFAMGCLDVLVSSDMMARGMDVDNVDYVISFDVPSSEIYYVHRVGRTARAGRKGTAITLVQTGQLLRFKKIVQLAHVKPNSMRLNDVVEEMKIPQTMMRDQTLQDLFTKTLENFQDLIK